MHALSQQLNDIIDSKKTNLALSADVKTTKELLLLAKQCGPSICILKTHIDIIEDFSYESTIIPLVALSKEHNFLLFEDRKFADIGHTVQSQYAAGIYRIADWAHITNCHILPGKGIVQGLREVGLPKGRALLLLSEMSSKGHFLQGSYTQAAYDMAEEFSDFVIGFVGQSPSPIPGMLMMTPGIGISKVGDALGQQYRSPSDAIAGGSDIIIVGRGITAASDAAAEAERYREAGWQARSCRV